MADGLITTMAELSAKLRSGGWIRITQASWSGAWGGVTYCSVNEHIPIDGALWHRLYRSGRLDTLSDTVDPRSGIRVWLAKLRPSSSAPRRLPHSS